jgi:hypothetical protein
VREHALVPNGLCERLAIRFAPDIENVNVDANELILETDEHAVDVIYEFGVRVPRPDKTGWVREADVDVATSKTSSFLAPRFDGLPRAVRDEHHAQPLPSHQWSETETSWIAVTSSQEEVQQSLAHDARTP